jgi:hypothetical protein
MFIDERKIVLNGLLTYDFTVFVFLVIITISIGILVFNYFVHCAAAQLS